METSSTPYIQGQALQSVCERLVPWTFAHSCQWHFKGTGSLFPRKKHVCRQWIQIKTSPVQRVPRYSQTSPKLTIAFRWGFGGAQGYCVLSEGCEAAHFQNHFGDGAVVVVPMELGDKRASRPSHCPAIAKGWVQLKCYPACLAHPRLWVQPSALLEVRQNSILCRGWNSVSLPLQIFGRKKSKSSVQKKKCLTLFSFLLFHFVVISAIFMSKRGSEVLSQQF